MRARTVIVTGAGRGLGRAYATTLAARGANVVVNDIDEDVAGEAVAEIVAAGGSAVSAYRSATTPDGAQAIVAAAVERFGGVDAVVCNAGFMRNGYLEDLTPEMLDAMLDVHIRGSFFLVQAAWARLRESGQGRVVLTSSSGGMFAMQGESNYAAAKAGVFGLCKALAFEGRDDGIRVNVILPKATTTIAGAKPVPGHEKNYPPGLREALRSRRRADAVAPFVEYLTSPECSVNGEAYAVGFGRFARVFVGETPGWSADEDELVTAEDIQARLPQIRALEGFAVPTDIYQETRYTASVIGVVEPDLDGIETDPGRQRSQTAT